ncbi:hypothetical protein BC834DRAFT_831956, partial [Gloeopeniophorella convolvens]
PSSPEAEAGICSMFNMTGTRLITGGADKTIKVRTALVRRAYCLADRPCVQMYAEQMS